MLFNFPKFIKCRWIVQKDEQLQIEVYDYFLWTVILFKERNGWKCALKRPVRWKDKQRFNRMKYKVEMKFHVDCTFCRSAMKGPPLEKMVVWCGWSAPKWLLPLEPWPEPRVNMTSPPCPPACDSCWWSSSVYKPDTTLRHACCDEVFARPIGCFDCAFLSLLFIRHNNIIFSAILDVFRSCIFFYDPHLEGSWKSLWI